MAITRDIIMGYLIFGELLALGTTFTPQLRARWEGVPPIPAIISMLCLVVGWPAFFIFALRRR